MWYAYILDILFEKKLNGNFKMDVLNVTNNIYVFTCDYLKLNHAAEYYICRHRTISEPSEDYQKKKKHLSQFEHCGQFVERLGYSFLRLL